MGISPFVIFVTEQKIVRAWLGLDCLGLGCQGSVLQTGYLYLFFKFPGEFWLGNSEYVFDRFAKNCRIITDRLRGFGVWF